MADRLSTARCIIDSLWLELTSLDMASHGPKAPSQPRSLVSNRLRPQCAKFVLQYAIGKCTWKEKRLRATLQLAQFLRYSLEMPLKGPAKLWNESQDSGPRSAARARIRYTLYAVIAPETVQTQANVARRKLL